MLNKPAFLARFSADCKWRQVANPHHEKSQPPSVTASMFFVPIRPHTYIFSIPMPRKTVNRKALRQEAEAAEAAGLAEKKKTAKKKAAKRKSRSKASADSRKRLFWGIFNQSLKRVEVFDFNQKKEADERADALNKAGKSQYFVQKVKEDIEEA